MSEVTQALLKALEAGKYNAAPSTLRQGSLHLFFTDENGNEREATDAEYNAAYARIDAEQEHQRLMVQDLP